MRLCRLKCAHTGMKLKVESKLKSPNTSFKAHMREKMRACMLKCDRAGIHVHMQRFIRACMLGTYMHTWILAWIRAWICACMLGNANQCLVYASVYACSLGQAPHACLDCRILALMTASMLGYTRACLGTQMLDCVHACMLGFTHACLGTRMNA